MKPDWQNKSFAKGGAATGSTTMHSKLKVGMSSLHSKIGAAINNMPQAPKPAVRKFADGGAVRTRSDEEIGDTNPRTGVVDPGSYERRMKQGEENMARLSSAVDSFKSFFSQKDKASPENVTGASGMSAADEAKKSAMSGGYQTPSTAEEKRREMADYMVKPTETESKTEINATPVETKAAPAPAPTKKAKQVASAKKASAPAPKTETKKTVSSDTAAPSVKATSAAPVSQPVAKPTAKPAQQGTWGIHNAVPNIKSAASSIEKSLNSPDGKWGVQNVIPNIKGMAKSASDYINNFETPAERRSRLEKAKK